MSADNGVYVGEFINTTTNETHYRVVHTTNIDDIDFMFRQSEEEGREEVRLIFEHGLVFENKEIALDKAFEIHDSKAIVEYGVCSLGPYEDIF